MGHDVVAGEAATDDLQLLDIDLGGRDQREDDPPAPEPPLVLSRRTARLGALALLAVGAVIGWAVTSGPEPEADDPARFAPTPMEQPDGVLSELDHADRAGTGAGDAAVTPLRRADRLRGEIGLVASASSADERPALWLIDSEGRLLARADLPLTRDDTEVPLVLARDNVYVIGDRDVYRLPAGLDGYAGVIAEDRRIVSGGRSDRVWLVDETRSTFAALDTIEADIGPSFTTAEPMADIWSGVTDGIIVSRPTDGSRRLSLLDPGGAPVDLGLAEPADGATVLHTSGDLALVHGPDTAVYDVREQTYVMEPSQLGDVVDGCMSPGGRFAAVVTADGTLRGVEMRTGQTWWVADDVPADLGITWTGPDQLVFIDGERLTAIDLPSGNAAGIATLSEGSDWRLVGSGTTC